MIMKLVILHERTIFLFSCREMYDVCGMLFFLLNYAKCRSIFHNISEFYSASLPLPPLIGVVSGNCKGPRDTAREEVRDEEVHLPRWQKYEAEVLSSRSMKH